MSYSPRAARRKTVSGGCGSQTSSPRARAVLHGRHDLVGFLVAEEALLAGVRVEPGHGDARAVDAQRQAGRLGQVDHLADARAGHPADGLFQRDMGGDVHHAQRATGQQHGHLFGPGALGQQFGVPGIMETGQVHGLFVQRGGDDGIHLARHGQVAGGKDVFHRGPPARGADLPDGAGGRVGVAQVEQRHAAGLVDALGRIGDAFKVGQVQVQPAGSAVQDALIADQQRAAGLEKLCVSQGFQGYFRADPAGIAEGDCQEGQGHKKPRSENKQVWVL